jgi:hypothetical protein
MPFVPEIFAEFSAPPEFSGYVLEKFMHIQGANPWCSDYKPGTLPLRHCIFIETYL